jgi:hypothetical protein
MTTHKLVARLEPWKAITAAAVVLVGAGATFATWQAGVARVEDLAKVREAVTAEVASVRHDERALEVRATRVETDLGWIKSALYQIAQQTGAATVPPPPP